MRVFFESPQRLKIELDADDLRELNVTYDELDYNTDKTRRIIRELLSRIGAEDDFGPNSGKILIEVFESKAGGCVLYFTAVKNSPASHRRRFKHLYAVWQLRSADDLFGAVDELKKLTPSKKISLHLLDGKYRLTLANISDKEELLLSEFAEKVGGIAAAIHTAEHGKLLSENALKYL